jgi:hypothetical protein
MLQGWSDCKVAGFTPEVDSSLRVSQDHKTHGVMRVALYAAGTTAIS